MRRGRHAGLMRVAYLGPAGTYSEEALRASAPGGIEEVPYPTIYDAVMAVHEGAVERAVVPIENALEGSVASRSTRWPSRPATCASSPRSCTRSITA